MGIDLPRDIGTRRLPWQRLARIIEHSPNESALARARRDQRPSIDTLFLRRIEYFMHLLVWAKTKAGKAGRDAPILIPLRGDDVGKKRDALALDEKLARRQEARRAELARMQPAPLSTKED